MLGDDCVYLMNVRENGNFMASRLQLYLIGLSSFILLPNLKAEFLLIMVIAVLMT